MREKMRVILLSLVFILSAQAETWAFCKNKGYYNQCSDLNLASNIIEKGNNKSYANYLAPPHTFHNEKLGRGVTKSQIQSAKRFLKVAMTPAKEDPLLAFYVASVIRKGNWTLSGYRYGYGAKQHKFYRKQIEYFEKSLSMKFYWYRQLSAKILGNIYYYGLLKAYANPYPYIVDIDYEKAAKYYGICGETCTFNYISSVLHTDPKKGWSLLAKIPGFPGPKLTNENYKQFTNAETKYQYLWAINRFGMYGVKKNEKSARKFYSILNKHEDGLPLYGIDLNTGMGLFSLFRIMKKDTVFTDGAAVQSIPTTPEAEIEVLHMALAKKYAKAARELYLKYSKGIGVSKDYLRAYAYLNLAAGFSKGEKERKEYEDWMSEKARDWKLSSQQVIYAQQLSKKILQKSKRTSSKKKPKASRSQGSGFYVSAFGHIITNNHVIKGCKEISIGNKNSKITVSVIAQDENNDIALLKSQKNKSIAFIRGGRGIRQGDDIIAYGYPLSGLLSSSAKITTGVVNSLSGLANDFRYMQVSAPVQPGNSGGPLLDKFGNVVGIVTAKINAMQVQKITGDIPQNINFAIKVSVVKDFLDANEVNYETRASKDRKETSDIAAEANRFTVRVLCQK
jgi:S1-C subfamily serine protease